MPDVTTIFRAKGHLPPGVMNKTEEQHAWLLEARKRAGEVVAYRFEPWSIHLAPRTHYSPDFLVILNDGTVEFHEVKAWMTDDAWAKLKFAAAMFPWFVFRLCLYEHGRLKSDEVVPCS